MAQAHDWKYALDEYIRQGDAKSAENSAAWQAAIGLQNLR